MSLIRARAHRAFTLVEILIVVVILGILAAIVVPQFSSATEQATSTAAYDQLTKVRRVIGVYYARNNNALPNILAGDGTWGELIGPTSGYMREAPPNPYVGRAASTVIIQRNTPDTAFQQTHGWVYNPATGEVWAGSFDANDRPFPRP